MRQFSPIGVLGQLPADAQPSIRQGEFGWASLQRSAYFVGRMTCRERRVGNFSHLSGYFSAPEIYPERTTLFVLRVVLRSRTGLALCFLSLTPDWPSQD